MFIVQVRSLEIKENDRELFAPFLDEAEELLWVGRPQKSFRYYFPQYLVLYAWNIPFFFIFLVAVTREPFEGGAVFLCLYTALFIFILPLVFVYFDFRHLHNVIFGLSNRRMFVRDIRREFPATIDILRESKFRESLHDDGVGDVYIASFKQSISRLRWRHSIWNTPSGRRWYLSRIQPLAFTRIENASEIAALCNELAGKIPEEAEPIGPGKIEAQAIGKKRSRFYSILKFYLFAVIALQLIGLVFVFLAALFIEFFSLVSG